MNSVLSDYLQKSTGYSESTVSSVVEAFCKFIQISMRQASEVKLEKFGTFYTKDLPEREGRNPRTGEAITIAPRRKADFKFSKSFIESIQPDAAATSEPSAPSSPSASSAQSSIPPSAGSSERRVPPPVPQHLMNSNKSWFVSTNGQSQDFMEKDLAKVATPETPVWSQETGWRLAKDIPSLAYLFNQAA